MNKLISIILCVLMLCVALCACGNNNSVSNAASEAISDVETDAADIISGNDGVVNDNDGYIGNETTSDYTNHTEETQHSTTSNATDYSTEDGMM